MVRHPSARRYLTLSSVSSASTSRSGTPSCCQRGTDPHPSPVIYTCFGQTRKRDVPETAVTHLCRCLEDMIVLMRRMDEDAAAEKAKTEQPKPEGEAKPEPKKKLSDTVKGGKWVWIVDFEDFGAPLTLTRTAARMRRDLCIHVHSF